MKHLQLATEATQAAYSERLMWKQRTISFQIVSSRMLVPVKLFANFVNGHI